MTKFSRTVLIADPDARARSFLVTQLEPLALQFREAEDGESAARILAAEQIHLLITELYLPVNGDPCLVAATRGATPDRLLPIIAHTHHALDENRAWALDAGADAYLIKPTRAARLRYVVGRLIVAPPVVATPATAGPLLRRDSLEDALADIEHGRLSESSCIVFGRVWWQSLTSTERMGFRARAKAVRVSLRSDSKLEQPFVEIRGRYRAGLGMSSEQPESPYRR